MPLLTSTRNTRHLGIDFRKFPVKTNKKLSVKNLQNWIFVKNGNFLAKNIHDFEFSKEYHYSRTLEDKQVKTLGSFQPKLMKKIVVLSQKPSKTGFLPKKDHFFTLFGQKIPNFDISHGCHYSHTLVDTWEKTLGSFQPKPMTKIDHFLTLFGQKNPQF